MKSFGAIAICLILFALVFNFGGVRDTIQSISNSTGGGFGYNSGVGCGEGLIDQATPSCGVQQSSYGYSQTSAPYPGYVRTNYAPNYSRAIPFNGQFRAPSRVWIAPVYRWAYAPYPHRVTVTQGYYKTTSY